MLDYLAEAGPPIWAVLVFGIPALAAAVLHALRPRGRQAPLALGAAVTSVIAGVLGTVTGYQYSISRLGEVAAEKRWIHLVGLSESLNNLVVALVIATLVSLLLMIGAYRRAATAPSH